MLVDRYPYKKCAYRCAHATHPHGWQMNFWEMPPENCPKCNAAVHRCPIASLVNTRPISLNGEAPPPYYVE